MRIGFLTTEYPTPESPSGGLGNYLRRISLGLAEAGHEPHVFFYTGRAAGIRADRGVYIHYIDSQPSTVLSIFNRLTRYRFRQTATALERAYRFRRYLREICSTVTLDIVQAPNSMVPGLVLPAHMPLIIRASSYRPLWDKYDGITLSLDRKLYTHLEAYQYRRADAVFAPSKFLAKLLEQKLPLRNVWVIRSPFYNEVQESDCSCYAQGLQEQEYLLFFGRLSPQKGPHVLAEALTDVWQHYPDLLAVFIGKDVRISRDQTMVDVIKSFSKGYERNLRIYAALTHNQLYPFIAHARLVVLPTFVDNAPNTMLEAMGLGRPVIGTYGSSMDEFIEDGISGFLVESGDSDELARKICAVWNRTDLLEIGKAASDAARVLKPERILPELLQFYEEHTPKES